MCIFSYYGGYDYTLQKYLKKVPFLCYNIVYCGKTKKDENPYKTKKKIKKAYMSKKNKQVGLIHFGLY